MNFKLFLFILHFQFILLETSVLLSVVANIHKTLHNPMICLMWLDLFVHPIILRIRVIAYTHQQTSYNPEAYE